MSYVSQQFLLRDNSTLANFKNWAQAISTALSSSGWTQTSDTGQVNWGTIASVPTAGTFVYEMWQPADALQTGSTVFYLKINYGTSSGSPAGPRLQLQIGTATDGAGSFTGLTSTSYESVATASNGFGSVITSDCYFSGDVDRFSFTLWRGLNTNQGQPTFAIERTQNTDGTNSSDGAVICQVGCSTTTGGGICVLVFGVAAQNTYATGTRWPTTYIQNNASGAFNNNIPISPIFPEYGKTGNPMKGMAFVHSQDVAEACLFSTTLYGATRTYIATVQQLFVPTGAKVCIRFD